MANKTVNTRQTHTVGSGTVTALTITSQPALGRISLHDCASIDQAGAHNEIWPRGAGSKVTFNIGLVVNCTDPSSGTVNITTV